MGDSPDRISSRSHSRERRRHDRVHRHEKTSHSHEKTDREGNQQKGNFYIGGNDWKAKLPILIEDEEEKKSVKDFILLEEPEIKENWERRKVEKKEENSGKSNYLSKIEKISDEELK